MRKAKSKNISKSKCDSKKSKTISENSRKVKTASKQFLKYPKKIRGEYICQFCPRSFTYQNNMYRHKKKCLIGQKLNWLPWKSIVSHSKKMADMKQTIKKILEEEDPKNFIQERPKIIYKNRIPNCIREELEIDEEEY